MADREPRPVKLSALDANSAPTDLEGMLARIERSAVIIQGWDQGRQKRVNDLRDSVEHLHAEAMRRMIRGLRTVPEAEQQLRDLMKDEVIYAVLRKLGVVRASLNEQVDQALAEARQQIEGHHGTVEIAEFLPPHGVRLRWIGACSLEGTMARSLREKVIRSVQSACPELRRIESVPALEDDHAER